MCGKQLSNPGSEVIMVGKSIFTLLLVMAILPAGAITCYAGGHGHHGGHFSGSIWIGPGWGIAWPGPCYPLYYSCDVPRTAVQPGYEENVRAPAPEEEDYWYYCRKPEGYYPYVKKCPGGWMKVVPPPEAPEGEE
jgi:hypothetical protein